MEEEGRFHRWALKEEDLRDLDPVKARDLIINCFYEAQRETFARTKQALGLSADDDRVHASVSAAIKLAFREIGEDFKKPTRKSLIGVVEVLSRKSTSWGTPEDIIDYHRDQIMKVLEKLK